MVVAYGCCVGSWERFERWVVPRVGDNPIVALSNQPSIAVAYNRIIAMWQYRTLEIDALVLLHDDLELTDPDAEDKFLTVLEDRNVGVVGVAGGSARNGLAWWTAEPVGHQLTDSLNIDFGKREGEVDLIEGSIMVFSPEVVGIAHFDEKLPGFHGYDEIAYRLKNSGLKIVVADVDTHHHTRVGFTSSESQDVWTQGDEYFRRKWNI